MRNLVKRYIAQLQRCKQQGEAIIEDDLAEIKQDISAFRYELLGILQNAGFNIGHTDFRQETLSFSCFTLSSFITARSRKRSLRAERRLLSGVAESMSIPMPEQLLNGTSDDDEINETNEVFRKERRSLY
ncbi:unnamed protein product [Onchocerca flexuosa]|uniref:Uncharacterized protein n=1 Tax=Onchocerca flexuosa TaxID=387005 RepID=A0A183HX78_9BILA|nr:unnamed protein product [Onchocerca flexuosa]